MLHLAIILITPYTISQITYHFFIANLPPFYDMTLSDLILGHTMYPYYASTLSSDRRQYLWNMMTGSNAKGIHGLAGIQKSTIIRPNYMRYCPDCIIEDRRNFGRAYWHRLHQTPGVFVCLKHNVFLEESNLSLIDRLSSKRYIFASPDKFELKQNSRHIPHFDYSALEIIASYIEFVFKFPIIDLNKDITKMRYQLLLKKTGYSISYRDSEMERFYNNMFLDFCPDKSLRELERHLPSISDPHWIRKTIYSMSIYSNPLQHVLLIASFGVSMSYFIGLIEMSFGDGPWACFNPFCDNYKQSVIDKIDIKLQPKG